MQIETDRRTERQPNRHTVLDTASTRVSEPVISQSGIRVLWFDWLQVSVLMCVPVCVRVSMYMSWQINEQTDRQSYRHRHTKKELKEMQTEKCFSRRGQLEEIKSRAGAK